MADYFIDTKRRYSHGGTDFIVMRRNGLGAGWKEVFTWNAEGGLGLERCKLFIAQHQEADAINLAKGFERCGP